jgi:Carboxypeptidase regulatory-like domain/TonB dependent receptor
MRDVLHTQTRTGPCWVHAGLLLACLISFLLPTSIRAQEVTAAMTGRVTDPTGAAVPGAKVTATDTQRGTQWPTVTNGDGIYNLPRLPVGNYNIKVENQGFQTALRGDITLVLNQIARVDFEMQVGNVSESVEVTSASPILQTEATQLGTVIDARTNVQLPLATRNYVQLTLLAPGAVTTDPSTFTGPVSSFNGGRPYINGNREQTDNFLLDGVDNNQVSENAVAYTPSPDAIQEFNMITQNASSEFGNFMGGIISVSIKSGTNQYHGGVFEFFRNDKLNANNWANNWNGLSKPLLRWNEFGGSIGGPIKKDKLFFFADYQGSRFDQPGTSSAFTVLTTAERTGNFSQLLSQQGVQLVNPTTKVPYAGNIIPASQLSPQAVAIMSSPLYPQPVNGGLTNNSVNTTHAYTNQDQGDVKIDWNISDSDHLFGRYSQAHIIQPTINSQTLLYNNQNLIPSHNGVLDYTKTISPSFVNDARFGVNYTPISTGQISGTGISAASVGIPGVPTNILPGFVFNAGNLKNNPAATGFGNAEILQEFADTVIQAEDTAVITKGNHTMRVGFQVFRDRIDTFYSGNAGVAGQFDFSGQYSHAAEADFMLGLPSEVQGGISGGTWGQRSTIYAAFFQDDWRLTPRLTLNLGLRYELNTPWVEVKGRQVNFTEFSGILQLPNQGNNSALLSQLQAAGIPAQFGSNNSLYNQYNGWTNYQPRLGFAFTPWGNTTVIRGAVTQSSYLEGTGTNLRLTLNPPFAIEHDIPYSPSQTPSTLAQGYTIFGGQSIASAFNGAGLRLWDPNTRPAVSDQWNFTVQHQFGNATTVQVGYVGQRNTHLMVPIFASQKFLNPNGTVSPGLYLAGNPTLQNEIGTAKLTDSNGNQSYHALQLAFQRRLSNGLEFQANYTWSKCMTNSIGYYGSGGQSAGNYYYWQNAYDAHSQWGPCFYDTEHAVNGFVTYDLPFGHNRAFGKNLNKWVNAVAGDWQVNSIVSFRGGFPYTIGNFEDSSQTHSAGPRANCVAPAQVFGTLSTPTGGYQWFNPNAYAAPALGTFGNCGIGTVRGPKLNTVDLSLTKIFPITERQNLEFRAEAINLSNTPILNAPNTSLPSGAISSGQFGNGNFGQITSSQGERNIQFALKYNF